MALYKFTLLSISFSSWIFSFVILIYSVFLSINNMSIKPGLLLVGFLSIAYICGYIIYETYYFIQFPILFLINRLFYKEDNDIFFNERVTTNIGIGFWAFSVFLFFRSILIFNFTFNFFWYSREKFHLDFTYNILVVFLIGFVWSVSTRMEEVKNISYCFASILNPIIYCMLFVLSYCVPTLLEITSFKWEYQAVVYVAAMIFFLTITPIFYRLAKSEFNSRVKSYVEIQ